ncbi:MAG: hypothetical protein SNJ57_10670 [Cyanobacteriota bacterium]
MTSLNDAGSNPITPSSSVPAEMNGNGASGHGNQPSQEPSQTTPQETLEKPHQGVRQGVRQGAIAHASEKPKTTVIVSTSDFPLSNQGSHRWLIASLLLTSMVAGLGGAALGWVIRHQSQKPYAADPPALLDPFVNNEQSFPPIEGWVGDDPVRQYSPDAFSEEVLPETRPHTAPPQERQFHNSPPAQSRRQIPEEFADPLSLPPIDEPAGTAPDTVPVEPPPQIAQPPAPSDFSPEPAPSGTFDAPPPAQSPPFSENIHKTKPSSAVPESPPRQTQSVDSPVLPTPASPSFP